MAKRKEFAAVAILVGGSLCFFACADANSGSPKNVAKKEEGLSVRVRRIASRSVPRFERRTGRAVPRQDVELAFGSPGIIRSIRVDEGDRVTAGSLLATIDTALLAAGLERAEAGLEQAQRELARAERLQRSKTVTGQLVDERKSQVRVARAEANARAAELRQARIFAPFDGRVVRRNAEPGAWARPGESVLQLASEDPIRVEVDVTDATRIHVKPKANARVRARSLPKTRTGTVVRVSSLADAQSGLFRVDIDVPNPDSALAGGQAVEVDIDCGVHSNVRELEADWVVYRYDGPSAVVVDDGRARTIHLGEHVIRSEGRFLVPVEVLPDRPVIVSGQHLVREGGPVNVVEER